MGRRDPNLCPRCDTRVSPFAAGCAVCGADLDAARHHGRPRRRSPLDRLPDAVRGVERSAVMAVLAVGALVLLFALADRAEDRRFSAAPPPPPPPERSIPADTRRVASLATAGAPTVTQRAALRSYLAGRRAGAPAIAAVLRHTVDGVALRPGAPRSARTRLGGRALLPAGVAWPRSPGGRALTFVAQVDLAELPPAPPLPRRGRLAFYWDLDGILHPDGQDTATGTRVYYVAPGAPADRPRPPRGAEASPARPLRGTPQPFPGEASAVAGELGDGPATDALVDAMNDLSATGVYTHHLLGASLDVQGPALGEILHGLRTGATAATRTRYSADELRDPRRWVLLAQFEEDDELHLADAGALYYAVPAADLRAGRFDRAVAIVQSH